MNKILRYFFLVLCLTGLYGILHGQQISLNNQYLVNKYSLSPAYAGSNGNFESFVAYRKDWLSVEGAPESRGINVNGGIFNNMGVGGTIISDQIGIFRTFSTSLSYAYHLKIATVQSLSFGISAGLLENHINLSSSTVQAADPVILNNQNVKAMTFDATFGILYQYENLNFGIVLPRLLESKIKNENDEELYQIARHYRIHLSYSYNINRNFEIEPFVIFTMTGNSGPFFEIAPMVKYKQQVWLAATYRKGNSIAMSIGGVPYDNFVVNYSYEFGQGIMSSSSGTHEISIGYLIGKDKKNQPSLINPNSKKPYYDWIDE